VSSLTCNLQARLEVDVKQRIAIWFSVGFIVGCCWVLYTFIATPQALSSALRLPIVQAFCALFLPIFSLLRKLPIHYWWIPPINAVTYAAVGLVFEFVRHKPAPVWRVTRFR